MRTCARLRAFTALLLLLASAIEASGQTTTDSRRMDEFDKRLQEMEQKYEKELKSRDARIERLEGELAEQRPATMPVDDIERTRAEVLKDIESREPGAIVERVKANFNPDIAVIVDTLGSWSNDRSNDAYNRFDVREAELDIRAAIDPRVDGVLVLAFERDVHNPIFPEEEEEEEEGVESSANIEEAYAFFHDFGVRGLTAKLGRFHVRFGRQNMLHLHDLPTSDAPFVNQAFLAPEALVDSGLSLSYVVSNPWNQYIEAIVEVLTGEGSDVESPIFTGDLSVDSPAINTHLLWNTDLTRELNFELGGSWMHAHRDPDNALDANVFGADLTLVRRDPSGGFNNRIYQAEVMYAIVDQEDAPTQDAWGAYVLAQQQLHKDWYAGVRLDWTQDPNDDDEEAWGVSPYVSWYWSEFLRFRLEYQHRDGDPGSSEILYFQCTFIFCAHPPHPYWAMR
jgi:hypothetical protein